MNDLEKMRSGRCLHAVTRAIPPRVIAAGNPCRVLHPLTEADRIAASEID